MAKATTGAQVLGSEPAIEELIAEWKRSMKEGKDPFIIIPNGWDTPGEGRRKAGNKKILEAKQKRAQADAEKDVFKRKQLVEEADKLAAEGRKMGGSISREIDLELAQNIVANERILDARTAWLTADKRGDEVGKRKAEQEAREARKAGGTIPNCDLDEMKRMIGNQMILSSKIMWAEAHKDQDVAKKEQAEKLAAKGRAMGGTITSDDDLEDAQRMVANEMIWGAKQIWDDAQKTGGDASGAVASAKYAREKMGANITIDHSTKEAGRVVADNRSHAASKYSNSKGRAWNGMYNKVDWENQAEQLYEQAGKPGGDKWAQDQLLLAEKILYGPPKEAESAKQKFDEAMKPVGETSEETSDPISQGKGYDTSGTLLANPTDLYKNSARLVSQIQSIDEKRFGKILKRFVDHYKNNREIYERISSKTNIPPQLIAAIHYREITSLSFGVYLHNGDPLGKPTVHVPKGKFFKEFDEAAVDALKDKQAIQKKYNITAKTNDLIALLAFAEEYNGTGYFNYRNIASPYAFSGTNVYKKGKYASDGVYDPNLVDEQAGVYILLKALETELGVCGEPTVKKLPVSSSPAKPPSGTNPLSSQNPNIEHFVKGVLPVDQNKFSFSGCAIASFTMVANFHGAKTDFKTVSNRYAPEGDLDFQKASDAFNLSYHRYNVSKSFTKSDVYRHIKQSVDNKLPCVVSSDGIDSKGKPSTHFAVVIGYTNDGLTDADIIIIDPFGGVQRTLDKMEIYKNKGKILSVREFKSK
ncbi:C39 family peptidase [Paenibacillus oleatilyticus]|uniref:C39 family peptidase n=1 Tax=Paenibacillus oleatilyticus TaxID=2594886 RepID=A0ABV4UVX8_9BACL